MLTLVHPAWGGQDPPKRRPGHPSPSKGSPALAVAIWRVTGASVEDLLRGKLAAVPPPGKDGAS
jgi:hypothetical protein